MLWILVIGFVLFLLADAFFFWCLLRANALSEEQERPWEAFDQPTKPPEITEQNVKKSER